MMKQLENLKIQRKLKPKNKMKKKIRIKTSKNEIRIEQWFLALILTASFLFRTPSIIKALSLSQNTQDQTEEASDASSVSEEEEETTIDNIKKVIQEKKDELGDISKNVRNKQAYLAKVTRVSAETIAVESCTGSKIVPIEDNVELNEDLEDIEIDDWVGVYGELEEDNFVTKKIEVYSQDFTPKNKKVMLASISEIHGDNLTVTGRSQDSKVTFALNNNTEYQDYQGEEASSDDLYKDLQCLIIAFEDKNGNYVISTLKALTVFDE